VGGPLVNDGFAIGWQDGTRLAKKAIHSFFITVVEYIKEPGMSLEG
jgi:hypothetical protein